MADIRTVYARVKSLGGTVDRGELRINLDAPAGKVWGSNLCHTLAYAPRRGERVNEYAQDMLNDLALGVTNCDTPDCDVCEEAK